MNPSRFMVEFRAAVEGNTLRGHAAVFNQTAELARGYEQIAPGAFDAALAAPDVDVRALLNHDPVLVLGRQSAGTLRLGVDKEGLAFEVDLPDTSYARDLKELMVRGDITGASFGFVPDLVKRGVTSNGKQLTTHLSVSRLLDVSPVTYPAYEGASVALRHIEFSRVTARGQAARIRALNALRRADR